MSSRDRSRGGEGEGSAVQPQSAAASTDHAGTSPNAHAVTHTAATSTGSDLEDSAGIVALLVRLRESATARTTLTAGGAASAPELLRSPVSGMTSADLVRCHNHCVNVLSAVGSTTARRRRANTQRHVLRRVALTAVRQHQLDSASGSAPGHLAELAVLAGCCDLDVASAVLDTLATHVRDAAVLAPKWLQALAAALRFATAACSEFSAYVAPPESGGGTRAVLAAAAKKRGGAIGQAAFDAGTDILGLFDGDTPSGGELEGKQGTEDGPALSPTGENAARKSSAATDVQYVQRYVYRRSLLARVAGAMKLAVTAAVDALGGLALVSETRQRYLYALASLLDALVDALPKDAGQRGEGMSREWRDEMLKQVGKFTTASSDSVDLYSAHLVGR